MLDTFIFDMDGTLLDSSAAMTYSVNFVRKKLGLKEIGKEYLEYHLNTLNETLALQLYGTSEYTKEQQELFRNHYLENSAKFIKPYDGVIELLEFLKSKDKELHIATNAPDFFAKTMLSNCKLDNFFTQIVGANNVERSKPHPDMLELLCPNSSTYRAVFIGDSIKDEMAAKNANMQFIFADWGYGESQSAKNRQKNIEELYNYLKNILIR